MRCGDEQEDSIYEEPKPQGEASQAILLMLAEKVYGYDGWGPPADGGWIQEFANSINQDTGLKKKLQQDGLDAMGARIAEAKRETPEDQLPSSQLRGLGPAALGGFGMSSFENMIEKFHPASGNFEALRRLAEHTAPGNKELHDSLRNISHDYDRSQGAATLSSEALA